MTIEEARDKKHDVEKQIGDIISKFSDETGLVVDSININWFNISMVQGARQLYQGVDLDVKLI